MVLNVVGSSPTSHPYKAVGFPAAFFVAFLVASGAKFGGPGGVPATAVAARRRPAGRRRWPCVLRSTCFLAEMFKNCESLQNFVLAVGKSTTARTNTENCSESTVATFSPKPHSQVSTDHQYICFRQAGTAFAGSNFREIHLSTGTLPAGASEEHRRA